MTLLVTSFEAATVEEVRALSSHAWDRGAEAVELRVDTFDDDPGNLCEFLKAHRDRTWIVTCRSREEGGHFRGDTKERVALIIAAARGTGAWVDFELADWRRSDSIRQKIRLAAARSDESGHRIILSAHDFDGLPYNLDQTVKEIGAAEGAVVAKVAYLASHISDSFAALDLMHQKRKSVCAVAMGEDGLWTRVLAKKLGAFATFCAADEKSATAPGQLTLDEMVNLFRWTELDEDTKVFGVLGDPVAHSMSPALFNTWFAQQEINAVYLPLRVRAKDNSLSRFLDECQKRNWLSIGGFSVTVPHKTAALQWAGDAADPMARSIGAVNTLSFCDEKPAAFNTDACAAVASLVNALGCQSSDLSGVSVDILGTGGAARAVIHGLHELGCRMTVYGRSPGKTRALASSYHADAADWNDRSARSGEIVINATSVGMWPAVEASPLPPDSLGHCKLVFDLIYNPLETALLGDARKAGVTTLNGLDMFVRQAATQFAIWTGNEPDTSGVRERLEKEITQ